MRSFLLVLFACSLTRAAAIVPVPTLQPAPGAELEPNRGQAKAGILFLSTGATAIAVTAASVLYSPLGVELSLVASNPNSQVSFSDPLPGVVNSYTGADPQKWVTGIPRYATAHLLGVYPGIDVRYTAGADGAVTLNLLFQPGVDPKTVVLKVAQATAIVRGSDGSLQVKFGTTPNNPLLYYPPPLAFQTAAAGQISRSVSFAVQSTTQFGFVVQGTDPTLPLQIAMKLSPAGSSPNFSIGSGAPRTGDTAGNVFFTATVADAAGKDAPFPAPARQACGSETGLPLTCADVAIYKFSAAGVLNFITYLSGRTNEIAEFIGLATDGTLAVAGTSDSSDFPVTATAVQPAYAGPPASFSTGRAAFTRGDFFAARLDPATGQLLASTYLGGPNGDVMGTAALGADGSLYFLPVWLGLPSNGMPVTGGALLSVCEGNPCANGYAAHLSPSLDKLIYGTYLPGVAQATAELFSDGSVYYAGTASPGFPTTPGAYQSQNAGGYDGLVARLDPSGTKLLFATYIGTPDTDWILGMAVAPDGSVWADVTSFDQCCIEIGNQLVHLDANGSRLLAHRPIDVGDMVVDKAGNLIALEYGNVTASPDAFLSSACGNVAYVKRTPSGDQLFATYLPSDSGGFDGADANGTPFLDYSSGRYQVVENQTMGPFAGCVVDAAAFGNAQSMSPGAIVTIFGNGLGPKEGIGFQLVNGKVPVTLGGTQVLVNGEPAPILYSSYSQVNMILPYSLAVQTKPTIQVVSGTTKTNPLSNSYVQAAGLTLFRVGNNVAAVNQDGALNSPQNPAQPGSVIALFGTGGGATVPPSVAGEVTPPVLRYLANPPQVVTIGSRPLTVTFAGAAPGLVSGVTQINVQLPAIIFTAPGVPKGTLPLTVIDGVNSNVSISVPAN